MRDAHSLTYPFVRGRRRLVVRVRDAQLLEPFDPRGARPLLVLPVDHWREPVLSRRHRLRVPEVARRTADGGREPVRRAGVRLDHRRRQHGPVHDVRIAFEHRRGDAAAHRMREQREPSAVCVGAADLLRELREIGGVAAPVVDVDDLVIGHVARRIAMAAVLEHAYRESGEQEVPDELAVFGRELGEAVREHDGAVVIARRPRDAELLEFGHVVAHVVQPAGRAQPRQRTPRPIRLRRFQISFMRACVHGGKRRLRHRLLHMPFVDHCDFHTDHPKRPARFAARRRLCVPYKAQPACVVDSYEAHIPYGTVG